MSIFVFCSRCRGEAACAAQGVCRKRRWKQQRKQEQKQAARAREIVEREVAAGRSPTGRIAQPYLPPLHRLFDPHKGQWWNAPPAQAFQAYYMTLRVHYGMQAWEAFSYAKKSAAALHLGETQAFLPALREAFREAK